MNALKPISRISITLIALASACSDAEGPGSNKVAFHGEQAVLPGFSKKTGLQPPASPVQLELAFSAGGSLVADANAVAGGSGDALTVAATPGSGIFKLDAHFKLVGTLHVDVSGIRYDGPIPGLDNIDIAFGAESAFDPFLIGGMVNVRAPIPETKLPPIPLPGGVPGSLVITIATGSVLTSDLKGTCAGLDGSTVQFLAETTTGGTLVLSPAIVIKLPVVGDKTFPIPQVTVQIPPTRAAMDLGMHEVAGGGDKPPGTSLASKGACMPGGGGGGGGGGVDAGVDAPPPDAADTARAQVNERTGRCLDTDAVSSVSTVACDGSMRQKWRREPGAPGRVRIVHVQSGLCLDSNQAGNVYVLACNAGNYQNWRPLAASTGFNLVNNQTSLCLDSNDAGSAYAITCNGGGYQRWLEQ